MYRVNERLQNVFCDLFVVDSVNTGYNIIKSLTMGDLQKCM
jgi:hypothetical protein